MKTKIKGKHIDYGFQRPTITIEQHIFGAANFSGKIINPTGQHDAFKPMYEPQAENFETRGCTVWGTENALEFLEKELFGAERNYEELPVYILAGIHPDKGGDPHNVSDVIHNNGLTQAPLAPFPVTREALLSLLDKPLPSNVEAAGKRWDRTFRHQWVLQGLESTAQRLEAIKGALQYGVVGASVTAWFTNEKGIYVDNGFPNSHWCVIYGWDDTQRAFKIFDSYDHSEKLYSYDSEIAYAKLYFLEKKATVEEKKNWYDGLVTFLRAFLEPKDSEEAIKKLEPILAPKPDIKEKLREVTIKSVGKDLSLVAPNELGCADSLSRLINMVLPDFPFFLSTKAIKSHLDSDRRFVGGESEPWVVIVSPTRGKEVGHCGILGEGGVIYSNNSKTGLFSAHWTLEEWIKYYKIQKGLGVYFYKLVITK